MTGGLASGGHAPAVGVDRPPRTDRYLAIAFTIGAGFVLLFAWGSLPNEVVPPLLVICGAMLGIGGVGQAAIAAAIYPARLRTTGVGWSSAMGRIGSIVGPGIAGFFLHLQWPARNIIAVAAVPALGAAAAALGIFLQTRRANTSREPPT